MKKKAWQTIRTKALLLQPNRLLQRLYPKAIWRSKSADKIIYLSFDDGPIELTEWVLDELNKYHAKANFFCVGDNVIKHPKTFERVMTEGHLVGNHTYHHVKGFKHTVASYMKEVEACHKLVQSPYFRPPYGQLRKSQYQALLKRKFKIVMWDVISYDYEKISPEKCLQNVLKNTREGSILLFHDNVKAEHNLRFVLPKVLAYFEQKGFSFRRLDSATI